MLLRRLLFGLGLGLLGSGLFLLTDLPLLRVVGGVVLFAACLAFSHLRDRRGDTTSLWRLDHFLPFVRKRRLPPGRPSWLTLGARRVLPERLFFDPVTGKAGVIRRLLQRLGPSVLASPVRRLSQAVCFLGFLWLFFYVCWPYHARPESPGAIEENLVLKDLDQAKGSLRLFSTKPLRGLWFLVDQGALTLQEGLIGRFEVNTIDDEILQLKALEGVASVRFDRLLLGLGPWALYEKEPGKWPSHYADTLARKSWVPAESFLVIDPLVSLSTAIASRSWVWSLLSAGSVLLVCVLIPRGFCGYLCPLGTLIDLTDWALGKRVTRFRVSGEGWWVHIKYYLLGGILVCAAAGVLVSGTFAAIPVVTRGILFLFEPLQTGIARGWHLAVPMNAGQWISIALFLGVLSLGLLRPRFWCKYVCPSGAVFSLGNLFRVTERKVEDSCIHCNKCVTVCPFDAIKPDFTTRVTDCTLCQTCGGVCPTHAIKFVERWNNSALKPFNLPPTGESAIGRRGFTSLVVGSAAALTGGVTTAAATKWFGARLDNPNAFRPVRPPGSVPEPAFLDLCIRCGECFKVCPNNVLQGLDFRQGFEGLWTPYANTDWAGCEASCNACGQVCPTGAIRALPMEEKRVARMGLAVVDESACLPYANREACQLCVDDCAAAGYDAIEFVQVHTKMDKDGRPQAGSGYLAPVVLPDKCVGCGLCQARCHGVNHLDKRLLTKSAIMVETGDGKEDRLAEGSYRALREADTQAKAVKATPLPEPVGDDPFGL